MVLDCTGASSSEGNKLVTRRVPEHSASPKRPPGPMQAVQGFVGSWSTPRPWGTGLDGRALGPLYGGSPASLTSSSVGVRHVRSFHALLGRRRVGPAVRLRFRGAPDAPLQHCPEPAGCRG